MAIETYIEEDVCLRLRNPESKLAPKDRPKDCGDCYNCTPDSIRNSYCTGNPKNWQKPSEIFIG